MISIKIDTSDLDRKLGALSAAQLAQDIGDAVADDVITEGAKYPAQSGRRRAFVSAKQRRGFFAALKKGAITVPYQRSGRLGGSAVKQPFGGGVDVTWQAPYAEIVMGEKQDKYFDNWRNVTKIAAHVEADNAELIATDKILQALTKAGLT
jgi:hypothetical protein